MAMGKCRECGKDVSSEAQTCPNCGVKEPVKAQPARTSNYAFTGLAIFLVFLWIAHATGGSGSKPTVEGATPGAAPSAAGGATAETPPLEVQSWHCEQEYGYMWVMGEVKNVSAEKLAHVTAVAEFRTASGELVKAEDALLEYNPIMPGQTSPFKAGGTQNPAATKCGLSFKYLLGGGEIAYTMKNKGGLHTGGRHTSQAEADATYCEYMREQGVSRASCSKTHTKR